MTVVPDWQTIAPAWHYAHGKPVIAGQIKLKPEDFKVVENLGFTPDADGEHIWLYISKIKQNTESVAKALAKHANVAYRDVGYAGLKDYQAFTAQWFSIYKPGGDSIDWNTFVMPGVKVEKSQRHNRKLRRGTHKSNSFEIRLREVNGDLSEIDRHIGLIKEFGVPNYFGSQRFGRDMNNLRQIHDAFDNNKRIKNRHIQGLLYSAARSWLFNCIVSKRIENGTWNKLYNSEPANLDGTNSVFRSEDPKLEANRLLELDIHPTAPMWGRVKQDHLMQYQQLSDFERSEINEYLVLAEGLEKAGLEYQRRPIRMKVGNLSYSQKADTVTLKFDLTRGQYATSVLRELVLTQ